MVVGVFIVYKSIQRISQFHLSKRWKQAEGTLLYKKVAMDNPYAADRAKSYFPYMKYRYRVGRITYVSDSVSNYRELRDFPEEIEVFMEALATPRLIVYYNPKYPSQSLLIADMPLHRKVFWIMMLLLGLGSFAAVFI